MSNALAQKNGSSIAARFNMTDDQLRLIKSHIAVGATDDELDLFLTRAKYYGLDPFTGQIHFVKRGKKGEEKATIQIGIDGFRLIADRTGLYAGSDEPVYEGRKAGKYKNQWGETDYLYPEKASVTVYKLVAGERRPFTASVFWAEFYPIESQGFQWRKMPFHMLAKVAEAHAIRKAFPAELSGAYTDEEMAQADHHAPSTPAAIQVTSEGEVIEGQVTEVIPPAPPRKREAFDMHTALSRPPFNIPTGKSGHKWRNCLYIYASKNEAIRSQTELSDEQYFTLLDAARNEKAASAIAPKLEGIYKKYLPMLEAEENPAEENPVPQAVITEDEPTAFGDWYLVWENGAAFMEGRITDVLPADAERQLDSPNIYAVYSEGKITAYYIDSDHRETAVNTFKEWMNGMNKQGKKEAKQK